MKDKYFGILPNELYLNNNEKEIENYLLDNKLLCFVKSGTPTNSYQTSNVGEFAIKPTFHPENSSYKYIDAIAENLYSFLTLHYERGLGNIILFNRDFDNETFGFLKFEKRKVALSYFNKIFSRNVKPSQIGVKYNSVKEIVTENRFTSLKKRRDSFKYKLRDNKQIVLPFLAGKKDFFNREVFENNELIKEIFIFENDLLILIDLNKKFQFEEDDIFIPKPKAKLIYEEYSDEFQSLEQVEFIEQQISSKEKVNRAFIVSLFDFFNTELIDTPSGEIFGEIINSCFGFGFGEIKLNGSEGESHSKRKKKWENFTN
jgi:hypothetical protein